MVFKFVTKLLFPGSKIQRRTKYSKITLSRGDTFTEQCNKTQDKLYALLKLQPKLLFLWWVPSIQEDVDCVLHRINEMKRIFKEVKYDSTLSTCVTKL